MRNLILGGIAVLALAVSMLGGYYYFGLDNLEEATSQQNQSQEGDPEEEGATDPEWAKQRRADAWRDENGVISTFGLANAVAQRDAYLSAHSTTATDGFGDNGIANMNWLSRGPQNIGGRTRSLVLGRYRTSMPRHQLWAGAVSGGIWLSNNDGNTWSAMNGGLQNFAVNFLVLDPPWSRVPSLWAGTGDGRLW